MVVPRSCSSLLRRFNPVTMGLVDPIGGKARIKLIGVEVPTNGLLHSR